MAAVCMALLFAPCTMLPAQPVFHPPSDAFALRVGGKERFVEQFKSFHYATLTVDKAENVAVVFHGGISSVRVSPRSKGIESRTQGNTVSFRIPGPGYYVVEINDSIRLFLLADAPERNVPRPNGKDVIRVTDYVTDITGATLQTEMLQRALDAASGSGKTLYFPPGVYLTGTITVGSDTDIYLAEGALIKGSADRRDYPSDDGRPEADHINNRANYSDNGEFMTFSRLVLIDNAERVRIRGQGVIDGSGTVVRAQGKPANLLRIRNSKEVLVEGIILRDPAAWNTHILHCDGVTVRGVKVLNDPEVPNTDGFDPDASRNVLIENCFACCSDDNIAIKTTNNAGLLQNLEHVTVRGCVFLTRKSSLKVGTETKGAVMRDILFEDNDVVMCDRGLALYCNDGALFENIRFVNNRIERNHPDSQRRAIHFVINERYGLGTMRNILIKDCSFAEDFPNGSVIRGLDPAHTIDGITFDNVTIKGVRMKSLGDLRITETPFVENIRIF